MKKILLTISAIAGFVFVGFAQDYGFEKGNVILEGSFRASSSNNGNLSTKESNFSFRPKVGYFISDKFALGVDVILSQSKRDSDPESSSFTKQRGNDFAAGVFGRYYFLEIGSRFKTYTEVGARYNQARMRAFDDPNVDEQKFGFNGFSTSAGIGANFFLTERIAINYLFTDLIAFSTSKQNDAPNAKSVSRFDANLNSFNNFFGSSSFGLTFKF
ncbi:outer membrane beta-barrel protein [Sphingobacterium chungjuense]|uniref:outer membrane beta-barrel protein n=1 Tax=Sphingobacterium chungjuense TaxID=2675553 RepID=UPI00140C98A5|nr:outer membrane beta-barrel protein [Sphingobacterium chungjuense]